MAASIAALQINDADARERLSAFIWAETLHLPRSFEISILNAPEAQGWILQIKQPDGSILRRSLNAEDLSPAAFKLRMRKTIQLLPPSASGAC